MTGLGKFKTLGIITIVVVLIVWLYAPSPPEREPLWKTLNKLDSAIVAIRRGDENSAKAPIENAREYYVEFAGNLPPGAITQEENERIIQTFDSLVQQPTKENIQELRSMISSIGEEAGAGISPIYRYAVYLVLLISVVLNVLVNLVSKYIVDWKWVRNARETINRYTREYREAYRTRDFKRLHKLEIEQRKNIAPIQSRMMIEVMKPTVIYMAPFFVLFRFLWWLYSGWVVAWLPFTLPVLGMVSMGFISWYVICSFGTSFIFRKLIIGD